MTRFAIVPDRSQLAAVARSSVHPIHGESSRLSGTIEIEINDGTVDLSVPPKAHVELDLDELSADNALYDGELKRRIDARRYPTVTGDLTDAKAAGPAGSFAVRGDLSLHGITHSVEGTASVRIEGSTLSADGELRFDMRDFGLDPPRILMLKVFPEVDVRIEIVAEREA